MTCSAVTKRLILREAAHPQNDMKIKLLRDGMRNTEPLWLACPITYQGNCYIIGEVTRGTKAAPPRIQIS